MKKYEKPDVMLTLLEQVDCLAASANGITVDGYDFEGTWL